MLDAEYVRSVLDYDPSTGVFKWKSFRSANAQEGFEAGATDAQGYRIISLDNRRYKAHRLAWLIMTGEMPDGDIDHIDMDRSNNRFANLRAASRSQNMANTRAKRGTLLGVKGVTWDKAKQRYAAQIQVGGKNKLIGRYLTVEEASAAYNREAERVFGGFARTA